MPDLVKTKLGGGGVFYGPPRDCCRYRRVVPGRHRMACGEAGRRFREGRWLAALIAVLLAAVVLRGADVGLSVIGFALFWDPSEWGNGDWIGAIVGGGIGLLGGRDRHLLHGQEHQGTTGTRLRDHRGHSLLDDLGRTVCRRCGLLKTTK